VVLNDLNSIRLLSASSRLNGELQDLEGNTPLILATKRGLFLCCESLLRLKPQTLMYNAIPKFDSPGGNFYFYSSDELE